MCQLLVKYNGNWAQFVNEVFRVTSKTYSDSSFPSRKANINNRVPSLKNSRLFVHMTLAANSRIRLLGGEGGGTMAYLTPGNSNDVFSTPLAMQYSVQKTFTNYAINVYDQPSPLNTLTGTRSAPSGFSASSFSEFPKYPPRNNQLLLVRVDGGTQNRQRFASPFPGTPTVSDIAAASSSDFEQSIESGLVPSAFSQYASVFTNGMTTTERDRTYASFNQVWQDQVFDNLAT